MTTGRPVGRVWAAPAQPSFREMMERLSLEGEEPSLGRQPRRSGRKEHAAYRLILQPHSLDKINPEVRIDGFVPIARSKKRQQCQLPPPFRTLAPTGPRTSPARTRTWMRRLPSSCPTPRCRATRTSFCSAVAGHALTQTGGGGAAILSRERDYQRGVGTRR